jgi:adenylate cyclase
MSEERAKRRLAAVLAADVAGYSRLMGQDEAGTLARLRAHRREVIDPQIAIHHGRLVKTTGDGFLIEFGSVLDALRCAVEIQQERAENNVGVAPDQRIDLRVGINVGDVVVENGDIFGDGVNVAARLEEFAAPGGIYVSARVQEDAAGRLPLSFVDLGDQQFKNIARPVRVFALTAEALATSPKVEISRLPKVRPPRSTLRWAFTIGILALAIAGGTAWWLRPAAKRVPSTAAAPMGSASLPAVARRLSIVVLPFFNLSNDPQKQYLADGITEDLTTDITRIGYSFVISGTTARSYKNKSITVKEIGQELGVRYVLEGSVQPLGRQIRINAQLIDAETETQVWSQRYDRDIADLSDVQTDITNQIAGALKLVLVRAEATRATSNPDALDFIFRGRAVLQKPHSRENYQEAITLFERALALDPNSPGVRTELAGALTLRVLDTFSDTEEADLDRADLLVSRVLAAYPDRPWAHYVKGSIYSARSQWAAAADEYEWIIARDDSDADALHALGQCKLFGGALDEVIPLEQKAMRLNPLDPQIANISNRIGLVYLLQSKLDDAIPWLEKALSANPNLSYVHSNLAAAYGLSGDRDRAAAELEQARKLRPGAFQNLAIIRARGQKLFGKNPSVFGLWEKTYLAGLSKAGVPDE